MTREEAKSYIGELKMYGKNRGWDEEYLIACDIALNELEQEPILDKINAEIIERDRNVKAIRSDGCCFFTAKEVLKIIDKYKTKVR